MVKRTNIARNVYLFSSFSDRGGLQVDLEGQRTQPRDYIVLSLMWNSGFNNHVLYINTKKKIKQYILPDILFKIFFFFQLRWFTSPYKEQKLTIYIKCYSDENIDLIIIFGTFIFTKKRYILLDFISVLLFPIAAICKMLLLWNNGFNNHFVYFNTKIKINIFEMTLSLFSFSDRNDLVTSAL